MAKKKKILIYHKQLTALLGGGTFQPLLFAAELHFTNGDFELAAAESARAAHAVGVVVGKYADPDLLDEVFKNFCIGK